MAYTPDPDRPGRPLDVNACLCAALILGAAITWAPSLLRAILRTIGA